MAARNKSLLMENGKRIISHGVSLCWEGWNIRLENVPILERCLSFT